MKGWWSPSALAALDAIVSRFADVAPAYSLRIVPQCTTAAEQLAACPLSGRVVPEFRVPQVRELNVRPYRLLYRVGPESVAILSIVHGAMRLGD